MGVILYALLLQIIYIRGEITSSLWDGVIKAGGNPSIIDKFANEVFPYDFDFNRETRKGDNFEIIVAGDKILFAKYESKLKGELVGIRYPPRGSGYYDINGVSLKRFFLIAPIKYFRISSKFSHSRLHPILKKRMPHPGIDYAAPIGTPVRSIGDGKILFAGWRKGFGKQVIIKHPNGYKSYYGHLSKFVVKKGEYVNQGELIGYVGSTGLSTGPHLDFRIKKNKKWINPLKLKSPRKEKLYGDKLNKYKKYVDYIFTLRDGLFLLGKIPIIQLKSTQ